MCATSLTATRKEALLAIRYLAWKLYYTISTKIYARLAELSKRNEIFWKAIKENDLQSLQEVLETSSEM